MDLSREEAGWIWEIKKAGYTFQEFSGLPDLLLKLDIMGWAGFIYCQGIGYPWQLTGDAIWSPAGSKLQKERTVSKLGYGQKVGLDELIKLLESQALFTNCQGKSNQLVFR